jgi:hypothetical protein
VDGLPAYLGVWRRAEASKNRQSLLSDLIPAILDSSKCLSGGSVEFCFLFDCTRTRVRLDTPSPCADVQQTQSLRSAASRKGKNDTQSNCKTFAGKLVRKMAIQFGFQRPETSTCHGSRRMLRAGIWFSFQSVLSPKNRNLILGCVVVD